MKEKNKNPRVTLLVIICLLVSYILYSSTVSPNCKLRSISGETYDPEAFISETIMKYGGLPKNTMGQLELTSDTTYSVKNWSISERLAHQNGAMFLGSNQYNYEFDIVVEFEDGDETILTYRDRRQGFVFCPFIVRDEPYRPGTFIRQQPIR